MIGSARNAYNHKILHFGYSLHVGFETDNQQYKASKKCNVKNAEAFPAAYGHF